VIVSRAVEILAVAAPLAVAALAWLRRTPMRDRDWAPDQAGTPRVGFEGSRVTVENVRNFHWTGAATFEARWESRSYDLGAVATAWYIIVPFTPRLRGPAHSFVSFGFDDGRYLAISIEARRRVGQTYDVLRGLFRRYELIYVVGDEMDLIGRRAVYDGTDVYLYQVLATPESIRTVLRSMLERADHLGEHPEFYNTITNNCTLDLVRHVNRHSPGRIPRSWRLALPGYSDEVAREAGLIDATLPLEAARQKHRINDRARAAMDSPDFSVRIRK
jgi:hypothetical protein